MKKRSASEKHDVLDKSIPRENQKRPEDVLVMMRLIDIIRYRINRQDTFVG